MDDASTTRSPNGRGPSRRRLLQMAAVGAVAAPAAAVAASDGPTESFTHRGHHVRVTRDGQHVALQVDGCVLPAAVRVRGDGVLACPELLPYSDAVWGDDVEELARRLIDGNGVDFVLF